MEGGVEFVAADAPYANRLMLHILAAFAEHERNLISERTRAALAAAKARGVSLGVNGSQLARTNRDAACEFADSLRSAVRQATSKGAVTLVEVAYELNLGGHVTRQGSRWSASTVHRLLRRLDVRL